jgi:glycerol-3-phosphate dehydrogenase (NAD(P)+)
VGEQLGRGRSLAEVLGSMTMVAEGVNTARAARELADRNGVEMPITEQVCEVLFAGKDPRDAMDDLLSRLARDERTGELL